MYNSIFVLGLIPFVAAATTSVPARSTACYADDCARAVTGTRKGEAFQSSARADCSSFLLQTVTGSIVTVTISGSVPTTTTTISTKKLPPYASACSGSSRFSSACSCGGITAGVTTIIPTVTVAATATSSITTSTTNSGSDAVYTPPVPTSYDGCIFDPVSGGQFQFIDPNTALPIVRNGTLAKVLQEAVEHYESMMYQAVKSTSDTPGIFDLKLVDNGEPSLLAIYRSGKVGFVSVSSNGQTLVSQDGDAYVTTVFSVTCDGLLVAGIVGAREITFSIADDQSVIADLHLPSQSRVKRSIPVPKGFYVKPQKAPTPPNYQRCFPGQTAVSNGVRPQSNGCGGKGGIKVPDFSFKQCCDQHDICYGTCSAGFNECNDNFYNCMRDVCRTKSPLSGIACLDAASIYYLFVSYAGKQYYDAGTAEDCTCQCDDTSKTACGEKCIDLTNDPKNCGSCYFNCPSGSCTNGACSFKSCSGSTCGAFGPCGPGGSCVCGSTSDGNGFCVNGKTSCFGLADCGTSDDCPLGSVCAVGSCCGRNVCVTTDECGGFNSKVKRAWVNATFASPGEWMAGI